MSRIWVVVDVAETEVRGILAGEALRGAASARKRSIEVEVRTRSGVLHPFEPEAARPGDLLLLVASGGREVEEPRFAGLARSQVAIEQVLGDAGAVIDGLGEAPMPAARRIVAVTACPTGIAHTFMAAEGLQQGAKKLGLELRVETQGSVGARDALTEEEIRRADLVVIAADREVDRSRFAGKQVFSSGTKQAIGDGAGLLERALVEAKLQPGGAPAPGAAPAKGAPGKRELAGPFKHLMTGVSYMLPFIVAGGLLIALAFALGGIHASDSSQAGTLAHALYQIGAMGGFALIVPALAGFIAYSIADRPGIAPGMIGGMLAANLGAGFLGGIAAGFIAGYSTDFLSRKISLPKNLAGLKPMLILPLFGTLITGLLMVYAVGEPVAAALAFLTSWLRGMQGASAFLLGLLLGAMMAFDMGGPVNKSAYAFATGLIASQVYTPMAAVMVAGMTPPLAAALATRLFRSRFTVEEHEAAGASAVLGLAFVTEGAIPFAARDPLRVIPALMVGSGIAGAISMALGCELKVPHGGVFVLPIPGAVTRVGGYFVALLAGTVVSALLLGLFKRPVAAAARGGQGTR